MSNVINLSKKRDEKKLTLNLSNQEILQEMIQNLEGLIEKIEQKQELSEQN
tara:strand:+ start:408 stop:560 length:153 start_codon:yes stop_codon:yes gene_type:complete